MTRSILTTSVAIVASFTIGLTWSYFTSSNQTGRVAVVDLDEVARRLGQDKQMTESLQSTGEKLQSGLANVQSQLEEQLRKNKANLGDQYTDEEAQQFVQNFNKSKLALSQLQQRARIQLNQSRQQLISDFRKQTQPVAAQVAKEKGFDTVVTRNDSFVFSFDNSVDITEDVVKLMSAEMPAKPTKAKTETKTQPTTTVEAPGETTTN